MMHKRNNEGGLEKPTLSNYQNHFPLSLQAVWSWTSRVFLKPNKEQMSPTFLIPCVSFPYICHIQSNPRFTLDNLACSASFHNTLLTYLAGSSSVYIYSVALGLSRGSVVLPRSLRLCRQTDILQTLKKKREKSHHLISPTVTACGGSFC